MNRKTILYASAVVAVLLLLVAFLVLDLFSTKDGAYAASVSDTESVYAGIPNDAVMVFRSSSMKEVSDLFTADGSVFGFCRDAHDGGMSDFIVRSGDLLGKYPFVFSVHYSGKNQISGLMSLSVGEEDIEDLRAAGYEPERYRNRIYADSGKGLFFRKIGGKLFVSDNAMILESAVRHMESGSSVMDNKEFSFLAKGRSSDRNVLVFNHQQAGKLFSGAGSSFSLDYADFVTSFTTWSAYSIDMDRTGIRGRGEILSMKQEANFASLFKDIQDVPSDLYSVLPAGTAVIFRMSTPDIEEFMKRYEGLVRLHGNITDYNWINHNITGDSGVGTRDWLMSVGPTEIAAIGMNIGETMEWSVMMKVKRGFDFAGLVSSKLSRDNNMTVQPFGYRGYLGALFGGIFKLADESFVTNYSDWLIIGSKRFIDGFIDRSYSMFTVSDLIANTAVQTFASNPSSLEMYVNLQEIKKTVPGFFNSRFAPLADSVVSGSNYQFLAYSLSGRSGMQTSDFVFYSDSLKTLPAPEYKEGVTVITGDTVITLDKGPYPVKNFINGRTNYLNFTSNGKMQLLNENRRSQWAVDFDGKVAGCVEQVDRYRNGKLQMLFCSGDRLWLVDRLGRKVSGYPKKLAKVVALGPKVYDFKGNREYSLMVLNSDNTFSLYDLGGEAYKGWNDISVPEKCVELPELVKVGRNYYWTVRSCMQTHVFTLEGKKVSGRDSRRIIDRNSEIDVLSDRTVAVKCTDGKEYVLDVVSGKMKRR